MRINQDTVLQGIRATLVPYTPAHVPRYHEWMQSEELQRLTASEPLSLEQEYEMQRSWRDDADSNESVLIKTLQKCRELQNAEAGKDLSLEILAGIKSFVESSSKADRVNHWVILVHQTIPRPNLLQRQSKCTFIVLDTERWSGQAHGEEDCMVGDVNLFLTDTEDPTLGEIEIMIAEPSYRGRGFGKEATLMMMSYGVTDLGITKFEAKIGQENEASICMFKKLHFKEVAVNSVFQEVTLRLDVSDEEKRWLLDQTSHVEKKTYSEVKLPAGEPET